MGKEVTSTNEGEDGEPLISIGRLSRETGLSPDTLRVWERRYGAPRSRRLPSGHRRYPLSELFRLTLAAKALQTGHRSGQVAAAPVETLLELLKKSESRAADAHGGSPSVNLVLKWITAAQSLDADALTRSLHDEWVQRGPLRFVEECVLPALESVGEQWASGRLTIAQEHFFSGQLEDFLSLQWRRLNERAPRSPFLLATFPGELHTLGLSLCALMTALTEHRVVYLGPQTPAEELKQAAWSLRPSACAISLSKVTDPRASMRWVSELRNELPPETALVVGGSGAPTEIEGVMWFASLDEFRRWAEGVP